MLSSAYIGACVQIGRSISIQPSALFRQNTAVLSFQRKQQDRSCINTRYNASEDRCDRSSYICRCFKAHSPLRRQKKHILSSENAHEPKELPPLTCAFCAFKALRTYCTYPCGIFRHYRLPHFQERRFSRTPLHGVPCYRINGCIPRNMALGKDLALCIAVYHGSFSQSFADKDDIFLAGIHERKTP